MAAAIRIRLSDLLKILTDKPKTRAPRPPTPAMAEDLDAIKKILESGPQKRGDLELELGISGDAILRRLHLLLASGVVVGVSDHSYRLKAD